MADHGSVVAADDPFSRVYKEHGVCTGGTCDHFSSLRSPGLKSPHEFPGQVSRGDERLLGRRSDDYVSQSYASGHRSGDGGGGFLAFMISFDNFAISYFLMPSGVTLPIEIQTSIKFGFTPEINAISTVIIGFSLIILLIVGIIMRSNLKDMLGGAKK